MNCKDGFEEEFYRAWDAGQVKRVADGKTMGPQRPWVGLTDEEVVNINDKHYNIAYRDFAADIAIARAIEAKLKEKNS